MGIGDDIKDVLSETASSYLIIRDAGNISGEYGDLSFSSQVTKPITIESFRRAVMAYDSQAVVGDVLEFESEDQRYLLMNKAYEQFENSKIAIEGVLYKCNVSSGELLRPSGEVWPTDTYHKETQWETIKSNCDAMQVAALYGNSLEEEEELALLGMRKDELYIPHSIGIQALYRFQPVSGEYYQVSTVESRRFPGVDVAVLTEDHR